MPRTNVRRIVFKLGVLIAMIGALSAIAPTRERSLAAPVVITIISGVSRTA
jgi:hypothetical protein